MDPQQVIAMFAEINRELSKAISTQIKYTVQATHRNDRIRDRYIERQMKESSIIVQKSHDYRINKRIQDK